MGRLGKPCRPFRVSCVWWQGINAARGVGLGIWAITIAHHALPPMLAHACRPTQRHVLPASPTYLSASPTQLITPNQSYSIPDNPDLPDRRNSGFGGSNAGSTLTLPPVHPALLTRPCLSQWIVVFSSFYSFFFFRNNLRERTGEEEGIAGQDFGNSPTGSQHLNPHMGKVGYQGKQGYQGFNRWD